MRFPGQVPGFLSYNGITASFKPMLTHVTRMSTENSDDEQNYTKAVGTRLTPQTKDRFDQYKQRNDLGDSQALRDIVDRGLEAEQDGKELVSVDDTVDREALALASFVATASFLLVQFFGTDPNLGAAIGGAYIILTLIWGNWPVISRLWS